MTDAEYAQINANASRTVELLFDKAIFHEGVRYCHIDSVLRAIDHIRETTIK